MRPEVVVSGADIFLVCGADRFQLTHADAAILISELRLALVKVPL